MNKSYMLVICLLAASFTGCLGSEDIEPSIVKEEDTIEPVGMGDNGGNETNNYNETNHYFYNNDTYYVNGTDYLELISQVENLTAEVEALRLEIEVMQSSKYDVPENSSIMIYDSHTYNHDDNEEQFYLTEKYEIIKSGNTITFEYLGPRTSSSHFLSTERNCTNQYPDITFMNGESDIIMSISGSYSNYMKRGFDIVKECEVDPDFEDVVNHKYEYWTTITITLPEEPVRFAFSSSEIYTFS